MKKSRKLLTLLLCILLLPFSFFVPSVQGAPNSFVTVVAGTQSTLALHADGSVWSWGLNQGGQLGDGTTSTRTFIAPVKGLDHVKTVAAGGMVSTAVKNDGTVWIWGGSSYLLGDRVGKERYLPAVVPDLYDVKKVATGGSHLVVLKNDGTVWAWGYNAEGQLGDGTTTSVSVPKQVLDLNNVVDIASGGFHTLALLEDGTLWSWGHNSSGQLGNGQVEQDSLLPVKIQGLTDVVAISAGQYYSAALQGDGTVWTWGSNRSGNLGNGSTKNEYTPVRVEGLTQVQAISAGDSHMMALLEDGSVWIWGKDFTKPLTSEDSELLTPTKVIGLSKVKAIEAGPCNYIAVTSDGQILTWGNNLGILGDGTGNHRTLPGPVVDTLIPTNIRLAGSDRVDTAIAVSKKMFPANMSADAVLLATSTNFPDALVGASLGVIKNAPLLLVEPTGTNQKIVAEINRVLRPGGKIYLLGGTGVISAAFEKELDYLTYHHYAIKRLAGNSRYGTAVEIAKEVKSSGGGEVIIATGGNFPDSLAISPYAAALGIPMVLVEKNLIPTETLAYLQNLKPTLLTLVGGEGVVSTKVETELQNLFPQAELQRFGGGNRYETSAEVAQALFGDQASNLFVATGTNFPDALAGSIFAGSTSSPIILVQPNNTPPEIKDYLDSLSSKKVIILGGTGVVSENVFKGLITSLNQ